MKNSNVQMVVASLLLAACGSSQDPTSTGTPAASDSFNPGVVAEGYTRLVSPTVRDVKPGDDVTYCQYVMAPFDHDVDVLDVKGVQSPFGHHAVAFTYTDNGSLALGESVQCMGTEFTSGAPGTDAGSNSGLGALASIGAFLGGVGGTASKDGGSTLPPGVAFRLKKGAGIMLNVHYLNTGEKTIDGNSVVDMKFAETDASRTIASMFVNVNAGFKLAPDAPTTSSTDCVAGGDLNLIMMSNHMHEYGVSATTQVIPAGTTAPQMLHEDKTWTFDMQFNPVYTRWPLATPMTVHAGDTIRTTCNWQNTTADSLGFPREMCIGVGFAVTPNAETAPMCFQGTWIAKGI